jgi:hypothetical protein
MGFQGGNTGALPAHTHDPAIPRDGGTLEANKTSFDLTDQSILVSDGTNIQELGVGSDGTALKVSGSNIVWGADTGATLIQVSKTYSDITSGTIAIYTLPAAAALTNVYTDITSTFDVSTAVTVGDAADNNGFQQTADFTSAGLTAATRGVYVTNFQGMRSATATTPILAYNFNTGGTSSLAYSGNTVDVSAKEGGPAGCQIVDSGDKMFITGGTDKVYRYDLSSSYDVSTASFHSELNIVGQTSNPTGITFNTTGSKMFVIGSGGGGAITNTIFEYALSTPYDLSTATHSVSDVFSVNSQSTEPRGFCFNTAGTKFYVTDITSNVYEYTCTAFSINTGSYTGTSHNFSGDDTSTRDIAWMDSGSTLVMIGAGSDQVITYTCSTPFDLSTVGSLQNSFSVAAQESAPMGLSIPSTTKLYVSGEGGGGDVYEYTMTAPDTQGAVTFYLQIMS